MSGWVWTSQSTSSPLKRAFSFYATLTSPDPTGGSGLSPTRAVASFGAIFALPMDAAGAPLYGVPVAGCDIAVSGLSVMPSASTAAMTWTPSAASMAKAV